MAHPFGNHPTFAMYLTWAINHGCTVKTGFTTSGLPTTLVEVKATGKHFIDVGMEQTEFLLPTTINRLDRRLGMKSPFDSWDYSGKSD